MASPDDPEALQDAFGTSRTHPAALRRDIEAFLNSPDPELELLKALALDELAGNERMERQAHARALALAAATGGATPSRPANPCDDGRVQAPVTGHADAIERAGAAHLSCAPDDPVLAPILAARSTPEVVRLLLEHARRAAPDRRWPYVYVLAGGGVETRRMVADLPLDTLGDDAADYLRVHLRHAAGASGNDGHALAGVPPADAAPPPTAAVLHTWRTRLGRPSDARWDAAFMGLTRHDPATVVRWLVHQTGGHHRPVAWFGHACTRDCARHLGQLAARARDPWARTAAAIYLAFHDEPAGLAALRSAMTTPGGPGAWAALALARRGDATALRRAAQVLDPATRTNDANDPTRIESLRERVLELLSNSLAREGVHLVLPGRPRLHDEGMDDAAARDEGLDARVHAYAQDLLARHPDLVPVDPWLPALAARRVD